MQRGLAVGQHDVAIKQVAVHNLGALPLLRAAARGAAQEPRLVVRCAQHARLARGEGGEQQLLGQALALLQWVGRVRWGVMGDSGFRV